MGQLPADLRASCSASTDTSATCRLPDGTVVFYRLFDTATEARADVVNGNELAPNGTPCPPSAAPPAETPVVCSYEVGAETGVAAFSQTVQRPQRFYEVRWNPNAHPRLTRRDDDGEHHCAGLGKPPIQLDATRRDALSAEGYRSRDISSRDALIEPSAMDRVISIASFEGPNYDGRYRH